MNVSELLALWFQNTTPAYDLINLCNFDQLKITAKQLYITPNPKNTM